MATAVAKSSGPGPKPPDLEPNIAFIAMEAAILSKETMVGAIAAINHSKMYVKSSYQTETVKYDDQHDKKLL